MASKRIADLGADAGWGELAARYHDDRGLTVGLTLVLGAGVSKGCGLPDWPTLLTRMAATRPDLPTVAELGAAGMGLPAIAALLRDGLEPLDFAARVRDALYGGDAETPRFPFFPGGSQGRRRGEELARFVIETNPTMRAVAAFCALPAPEPEGRKPKKKQRWLHNPRLRAVVTTNLDEVLEAYVEVRYPGLARYRKRLLRTVERATAMPKPGQINVYHLHGHIHYDPRWEDPTKNAPDALVLGEHEYFDVFDNPTSIFTYTFLHLLRESHCLFVGLSMNDDNLRRMLHYSRRELIAGYQAERRKPKPAKLLRHFAVLPAPRSPRLAEAQRRSLAGLGVIPLWVKPDFSDLPDRLGELYEAPGERWQAVWEASTASRDEP